MGELNKRRDEEARDDASGRPRASSLDLPEEELRELASRASAFVADYFARVSEFPVFPDTSAAEVSRLFRAPVPEEGEPTERVLEDCRAVFDHSRHNGSPRMFGYVASPAAPVGAFADLLASALNSNVTSWRSAPAATEIERTVVRWLATLVGFVKEDSKTDDDDRARGDDERANTNDEDARPSPPSNSGGLLTSGGSMANLNALYIAHRAKTRETRDGQRHAKRAGADKPASHPSSNAAAPPSSGSPSSAAAPSAFDPSRDGLWNAAAPATLYVSDQVHLSIPKAADVLGLGRAQVRVVGTDAHLRMDVRELRERVAADLKENMRPFCVVASAGTVSTGAVDPLAEVARVAREYDLWFHVDGAYGALAALDSSKRALFEGLGEADSVSLDPHKWLYAPLGCGCLLLRDMARARAAFDATAEDYIRVYEREPDEAFAFWDYGVELSRPFRALKVWMMLRRYGARRLSACVAEDNALAAYLAERVRESEDLELLAPVTLGICCFRYVPPHLKNEVRATAAGGGGRRADELEEHLNELNARVMHAVQRGGRAYLSNALLRGRFALRVSVTNFRTTRRDLDDTLEAVREAARRLVNGAS